MTWIATTDLRWLTAICQTLIGAALMAVTARVYMMSLHERAELFGPVFTDKGVRWFMHTVPLMGFLGAFWLVSGVSKWAFYKRYIGEMATATANAIGTFEAMMAVLVTLHFGLALWRFGRNGN